MPPTEMLRAITLLAMLLLAIPAQAAVIGDTVQGSVRLADKQMPLPRGEWIVAGLASQELPHEAGGPYGAIGTAVLLRQASGRIIAIAEFNTNEVALSGGWDVAASCDGASPALRLIRYRSRIDFACAYATESQITGGPAAWQQALDFITLHKLQLPSAMLTAAFIASDRQDFVDARLHFAPDGFPAGEAAQQLVLQWASRFAPQLDDGLANRLTGEPLDDPLRAALLSETPALDQRLLTLERLRQNGRITGAELRSQERAALTEMPRSAEGPPGTAGTWYQRLSTPVINFVTALSVTQNPPLALAIAATEQAAHSVLADAGQAAWETKLAEIEQRRVAPPPIVHIGDRPRRSGETS